MTNGTPAEVAQRLLGKIDWVSGTRGYCACPGAALHTSTTAAKDCQVMLEGVPTIYCFHTSCVGVVEEINRALRKGLATGQAGYMPRPISVEEKERQRERERLMKLGQRAKASAEEVLARFAPKAEKLFSESPIELGSDDAEHWRLHLEALFEPEDVVWVGDTKDSCNDEAEPERKAFCEARFRMVGDWLHESEAPGQFTCPSVFKAGVHSRSNANVVTRRNLVVESDVLRKEQMRALFAWLSQFLTLRAVVDTAGKSLHGWFEPPAQPVEKELRVMLPAMGCDPAMFKLAQPCRLPGALRGDKRQRLLWMNGKGKS